MRSTAKRFVVVMMAMAMVVALPAVALAHHPEITAETGLRAAEMAAGVSTTRQRRGPPLMVQRRERTTHIDIYVNGALVDTGAFMQPLSFSFSGTYVVPFGTDSVTVRAVARTGVAWAKRALARQSV